MNIHFKQISTLFLVSVASLFMLQAHAGKPVKITVTEAVPNEAIQGDALPVRIKGTGFDPGSSVRFIVTDTRDDTQIEVGTVIYDSDTGDLVAHVKVKDQAQVIDYDVEVRTSSGRRGKGTTLFRVRYKEGQEDPCVNPETFVPDFAFLRDTGRTKGRYKTPTEVTIVLAESFTGCETNLLEFPIVAPVNQLRNLKFSSVENENGFFGRVVWTSNWSITALSVWMQDFYVVGAEVIPVGGPVEILRNMLDDDPLESENIQSLDLSHDSRTLVYSYRYSYPDPNNIDTNISHHTLRILDIDACGQPGADPCGFGDLDNVAELESSSEAGGSFWYPVWGPLGNRIYVKVWFDDPVIGFYHALRYYDLEGNWQSAEWPPEIVHADTVISDFGRDGEIVTDYGWYRIVSSGIMGGIEYLAISDEFSVKTGGCEGVFIVEAEDCLVNGNCTTEPEFAGDYPSFTKDGTLIHAYDGWVPAGECSLRSVGYWDANGNLESLFDGYRPDAAGGIR